MNNTKRESPVIPTLVCGTETWGLTKTNHEKIC